MNLSIYIKLQLANTFGKVSIREKYKHLEYMLDNDFITPIFDDFTKMGKWPVSIDNNWYNVTSTGKKAMWDQGHLLITRIISWLALLISLTALLINYLTQ